MTQKTPTQPRIIPRPEHTISRKDIDPDALKVLYRLNSHGYDAYLVGGCVRDLLLNHHPKDFDIATNAHPEEIQAVFKNCRLIGRRFRLAHIYFGRHIVEVATFRGHHTDVSEENKIGLADQTGMILRDNVYGTIEEDASRRDFTINALYYNIKDFSLVDFTDGVTDLNKKQLRMIGDPDARYREDPVRMLRAARFVAKLGMDISPETAKPIKALAHLLEQIAPSRLFDEVIKLFHTKHAAKVYPILKEHGLFQVLFPEVSALISTEDGEQWDRMLAIAFHETDQRLLSGKTVSCAFLYAALLWSVVYQKQKRYEADMPTAQAIHEAAYETLSQQQQKTGLPKRFIHDILEIWQLQWRFPKRQPKSVWRTLNSHRFRAAFDLLILRAKLDKKLEETAKWWQEFQTQDRAGQDAMLTKAQAKKSKKKTSS